MDSHRFCFVNQRRSCSSMHTHNRTNFFSYPRQDLVAGSVGFLVSIPLCLGIAIACGVPPVSGLLAGVIGGIIVPLWSRAPLSVSGPAAGLITIGLVSIEQVGGINGFLTAVVIAGCFQVLLGILCVGRWSAVVPSSVVKGMLAAIGITIIMKQIPVALGCAGGLRDLASHFQLGADLIAAVSFAILFGWRHTPLARISFLPAALVAVVVSCLLAALLSDQPAWRLTPEQLVVIPTGGLSALASALPRPDWSLLNGSQVWMTAAVIAVIASIETTLTCQAVDRLDPLKRHTPLDRELVAQGCANTIAGLLGAFPVTAVIVRSSANVAAGGRERLSAITSGLLMLLCVIFLSLLLNKIPLACLAAVLIQVGLNLCKPTMFLQQRKLGWNQFLPFAVTIIAVLATDLMTGVIVGVIVGIALTIREGTRGAIERTTDADGRIRIRFRHPANFLLKPQIASVFERLPDGSRVVLDATGESVDHDVTEAIAILVDAAHARQIEIEIVGLDLSVVSVKNGH